MQTFKDFRGLAIPARALELGFVDESWHNDASARMTARSRLLTLTLWVGDDSSKDEVGYRYAVDVAPSIMVDGNWEADQSRYEIVYYGDDVNAALDAAQRIIDAFHGVGLFTGFTRLASPEV